MGTKSNIQYAINILMEESGHKGSELADALGVSRSAVSNWMNGKNSIDIELVPSICDFFGITVDEFFGRSEVSHLTEEDASLLNMFHSLNDRGRARLLEEAEMMTRSEMFAKSEDNQVQRTA